MPKIPNKINYLLGRAERLVSQIPPPRIDPSKSHPYTLDDAKERVVPMLEATAASLATIPAAACPNDEAVALMTLHPAYLAKSYFPERLLDDTNLRAVGSRKRLVSPSAWTTVEQPRNVVTAELFVAGNRKDFERLARFASNLTGGSRAAGDFIKIEEFRSYPIAERIRTPKPKLAVTYWEIILHATGLADSAYILEGFRDYLDELDLKVDLDERLQAQGLCFLPVRVPKEQISEVAQFSFLRAAREMPRMRPVIRASSPATTFTVKLPAAAAVDPTIRVAIFDGGLPTSPDISRWAARKKANGVGKAHPALVEHGLGVTSALLFGPLDEDVELPQPYTNVDHIRVLDVDSDKDNSGQYFDIIRRIMTTLENGRYEFVNFSIGPDLEVEDDNVHVWTAMLDQYLKQGTTLASIAVGNTGEKDHASGNARTQVPSDCVNAMAFGSADSLGSVWKRSAHSSIGPGRSPGIVKPDLLGFGGSPKNPFYVLGTNGDADAVIGTSFAGPAALRAAIGVRTYLGPILSPLALKSLLIHRSYSSDLPQHEIGWGKVAESLEELIRCDDNSVSIVYQGLMSAGNWMRAPIPVPDQEMLGMVDLTATICFATDTDPQDPIHYTRSGLEVVFRPHSGRRNDPKKRDPDSAPFFSAGKLYAGEEELRNDAHKWETTLHARTRKRGSSFKDPTFDIHYNARDAGSKAGKAPDIQYALIVTVSARRVRDLYDRVVRRYRTRLDVLKPIIEIPLRGA